MTPSLLLACILMLACYGVISREQTDQDTKIAVVTIMLSAALGIFVGRFLDLCF